MSSALDKLGAFWNPHGVSIETRATMVCAEARTESRGAHVRDDANWLKHSLWYPRRQPP